MMVERFLRKVRKTDSCWMWMGAKNNYGYGNFYYGGRMVRAHRVSLKLFRHDFPDELVVDHLCRNKLCVNPDHLDAVTQQVNVARYYAAKEPKPICVNGHAMINDNTYLHDNRRICKECKRESTRRWRQKLRVAI
jgi:hypothetical protein